MPKTLKTYLLSAAAVAVILTALAPAAAKAQVSRIYLAGYMGLNTYNDQEFSTNDATVPQGDLKYDNAPSFAGALGLRLSKQIRVEAELSYRKPSINEINIDGMTFDAGGQIKHWAGLMNVYYDFDVPWKITPYITGGVGMSYFDAQLDLAGDTDAQSAYGLTWQAGAGLKYRPRDNLAYTLGYRYMDTTDLDMGDLDLNYASHEFRIGLEYDLDWR